MQSSIKLVAWSLCAATAALLGGCNNPVVQVDSPSDGTSVGSPVAVRFGWSPVNPMQGGFTGTLDGQNIASQLTFNQYSLSFVEDGVFPLGLGTHTLSGTASLLNPDTGMSVSSTATSTFTVAAPCFAIAISPQPIRLAPGETTNAVVSIQRFNYTDRVDVTLSPVGVVWPVGLTVTIPAGENSVVFPIQALGNATPGTTEQLLLTAVGTEPPLQQIFVMAQVTGQTPPPTFAEIYANYFQQPSTPGHCFSCHANNPARGFFAPGPDKDGFYAGLIATPANGGPPLVNTGNPMASRLIDPMTSPLRWFNANGNMPLGNAVPNAQAASDIARWVNAGALNNSNVDGSGGSGGSSGSGSGGPGSGGASGSGGAGDGSGGSCSGDPCGPGRMCCGDLLPDCSCSMCSPPNGECP